MSDVAADDPIHDLVQPFADGELPAGEAARFREHLVDCAACQEELREIMVMAAVMQTHAPALAAAAGGSESPAAAKVSEPAAKVSGPPVEVSEPAPVIALASRRRRTLVAVTTALAAAAAVLIGWRLTRLEPVLLAQAEVRPLEARLSYSGADRWRPYDVMRAAGPAREEVALDALAKLEQRGDQHGLGVGYLLSGEGERAGEALARAGDSAEVTSDRAALALQRHDVERALIEADRALGAAPGHGPALWNRALALRDLGLPLAAAQAFDAVAERGEPGWSPEARQRAAALRAAEGERERAYRAADAAARAMVAGGPPPSPAEVRAFPGLMRHRLYDAVRAAPSKARVEELMGVAEALEGGDPARPLTARLRQAGEHAGRQAALAAIYGTLAARPSSLAPAAAEAYLGRLTAAHADDLKLGALVLLGRQVAARAELRRLAALQNDPWWLSVADEADGQAALAAGDAAGAERLLVAADRRCLAAHLDDRCAALELALADAQLRQRRADEAHQTALAGLARARAAAVDPRDLERRFLVLLAEIARSRNLPALAAAYVAEARLRMP
jgi:putative zinc finger protein